MVVAIAEALVRRTINSPPVPSQLFSQNTTLAVRIVTTACASLSVLAGVLALVWFAQMKRKFRHTLIMTLIIADLVKDLNYVSFAIVTFVRGSVASSSAYCQVSGFIGQASIEITDFSVLLIVMHMSLSILHPTFAQAGLERFRYTILGVVFFMAILMASLAFVNPNGGYQLAGAYCSLPIRPFIYRLTLGWIERYIIAIVIVTLTVVIHVKVKGFQRTLARLQHDNWAVPPREMDRDIPEESDETDSGVGQDEAEFNQDSKKSLLDENLPGYHEKTGSIHDVDYHRISSTGFDKFKRQSYRKRPATVATNACDAQPRVVSMAVSAAPSSAIFSPYRDSFRLQEQTAENDDEIRSSSVFDAPNRRQSVAGLPPRCMSAMDMPRRRASLIDMNTARSSMIGPSGSGSGTRAGERTSALLPPPSRRASIWDEIDASLDKKISHRSSMLSLTPSQHQQDAPAGPTTSLMPASGRPNSRSPHRASTYTIQPAASVASSISPPLHVNTSLSSATRRPSFRQSRVFDAARRTLSIMSRRSTDQVTDLEPPASPTAILQRRHRYIQRQMRYLILYPFVYLGLWLCPFVLHCMQYEDLYARNPPEALVFLSFISLTIFGFANSLVFSLREKPWTSIAGSDGTVWDSLRPGFLFGPKVKTSAAAAAV